MKLLRIAHVALTLFLGALLLAAVSAFAVLMRSGVIELHSKSARAAPESERSVDYTRAKARLLVVRGLRPNWEYQIYEGQNIIGRADEKPVDIDLQPQEPEDRVWSSRQHAVIICEGTTLTIEDLGSTNGTYVNRNRVPPGEKRPLRNGDIIQIGEVQIKVSF
jgi:hypothetical protein